MKIIIRLILSTVSFLVITGCTYYKFKPTVALNLEQSNEAPAVFEIYCGLTGYLFSLEDESGQVLFDALHMYGHMSPGPDYPLKIEVKPGKYTIDYRGHFHKTPSVINEAILEMKSGHYYRFASYMVMYEESWVWVEDLTTSEVVAGATPPRDVRKKWHNSHGFCRSRVLDYL